MARATGLRRGRCPNQRQGASRRGYSRMGLRRLRRLDQRADSRREKRERRCAVGYLAGWLSWRGVRLSFHAWWQGRDRADLFWLSYEILIQTCRLRSPEEVTKRLDRLVNDIRSRYHEGVIGRKQSPGEAIIPSDVLIVAHGHILRAFAMRWIKRELTEGVALLLEGKIDRSDYKLTENPSANSASNAAGGVGTLRFVCN